MATGSYSCSSNSVQVTDAAAVRDLLSQYDTHGQVEFTGDRISISSSSDKLKVADSAGNVAEKTFLRELSQYLEETLIITNTANPPREAETISEWVVDPESGVEIR